MNQMCMRIVAAWLLMLTPSIVHSEEVFEPLLVTSSEAQFLQKSLGAQRPETSTLPSMTQSPLMESPFYETAATGTVYPGAPAIPRPPPVIAPPPKFPDLTFTGVIQIDGIWTAQDNANINAPLPGPPPTTLGDIPDFVDFRRALFGVRGQVAENVNFALDVDFGLPGRPSFQDVWIETNELSVGTLRVGQTRQPALMDALTSLRELIFLERPSIFAFVPFYQTGVLLYGTSEDELVTYAVSGYRFPSDFFGGVVGDNGYGLAGRTTALLVEDQSVNLNVHLGGSFVHNQPANNTFRFRSQPELGATFGGSGIPPSSPIPYFVDTGAIPTDWYNLYGLELAASLGPILFQSEAMFNQVAQTTGADATFFATYAQVSYVLTGEVHPYHKKNAVFTRVVPDEPFGDGGYGAWEVATRLSYIDLNDGPIAGGRLTDFTAGLNWYLNRNTRVQFNYIHAWLDNPGNGHSDADLLAVRAQLDF